MTDPADRDGMFSRREYLILRTLEMSGGPGDMLSGFMAAEAVDSTALAHPEWNMDELRTFADWDDD